ncbi:hypothetical protein, partial [Roseovarius sp. D0-M9]|uniref:hypothetical protein n=1 Tax=Roseovarius sp. D0-M9 TaxID=3127117 RepID=UPI00300F7FFA
RRSAQAPARVTLRHNIWCGRELTGDPHTHTNREEAKIVAGVLTTLALTPAAASALEAAPDGFVVVDDMPGVTSFVVLDDGSLRLTLADGKTVVVAASDVRILDDGNILISSGVAEALLAAEGAAGAGVVLGAGAGLAALAAVAAGGGSSDGAAAPLTPEVQPVDLVDGETYNTSETSFRARLDGSGGEKSFTISAPNADRIELSGDLSDGTDIVSLTINDIPSDNRTLTLVTDELVSNEGPHRLVFDFSGVGGDADDVVTLAPDSNLSGFNEIEVKAGTLNVLGVNLPADTVFIVNSGLVLSLEQFMETASITSVTGHGEITVALENADQLAGLKAFLADSGSLILIGADVTVEVDGAPVSDVALAASIDAITFPSIPEIDALINDLQLQISTLSESTDLSVDDLTAFLGTLSGNVTTLTGQVTALQTLVGDTPVSEQITTAIDALTVTLAAADAALGARIDTLASDLSTEVTTLQGNINALSESTDLSVDDLTASLGTLSGNLATLTGQVTALQTLVGETPVSEQITTAIDALTVTLAAADAALGARIDTLASDLSTEVATLQSNINALSESTDISVDDLTTSLSTLSGNLATLTGQVTALQTLAGETPVSEQITTALLHKSV